MSSDITIGQVTVTAIQDEAISAVAPTDGYALIWDGYGQQWKPAAIPTPSNGFRRAEFTSNGTWTCPVGVSAVILTGFGGGGGAGGGSRNTNYGNNNPTSGTAGAGGGGSVQQSMSVVVIPGQTYNVWIGVGGFGGAGAQTYASFDNGLPGNDGGDTKFALGSNVLSLFIGARAGNL